MDNSALDEMERVARGAADTMYLHPTEAADYISAFNTTFDPPTIIALITAARRPALPDREAVANIIDPAGFDERIDVPGLRHEMALDERADDALTKADAIINLFALSPAQAERDGWVMVPREPTP